MKERKEMVNNFEKVKELFFTVLDEKNVNNDLFLKGKIIRRKKDNPEIKRDFVVCSYCFKSSEEFEKRIDEIIKLCDAMNARFYLNPTIKSYKSVTFDMLDSMSILLRHKTYRATKDLFEKASDMNKGFIKVWIMDVDKDENISLDDINKMVDKIKNEKFEFYIDELDTINGKHVFFKPHDIDKFETFNYFKKEIIAGEYLAYVHTCELKKNHSTLVYANI